ncbi:MAG: leucine-rich repeat domain-containing protein [Promethearchaeota archaeon]
MKEPITPEKIKNCFLDRKISEEKTAELLISLIEQIDDIEIRVQSIRMLQELKLYNKTIFKTLENYLVSDVNAIVRASIVRYILFNLSEKSITPLRWIIQHDNSPIVLKVFFDHSNKLTTHSIFKLILDDLFKWKQKFAFNIGVVPDESLFLLDLEALFARGKSNYEIDLFCYTLFKNLKDTKNSEPWLVIEKKHIKALNLNYFNWQYIKQNQDIINSLSQLNSLDLYLSSLRKYYYSNFDLTEIPPSIGELKRLKKLILKGNNLQKLPDSIKELSNLTELDLSHNNFQDIPQILKSLKSLRILNLKHNNIHEISKSMNNFVSCLVNFRL